MKLTAVLKGILFGVVIEAVIVVLMAVVCSFCEPGEGLVRIVMYISLAVIVTLAAYLISANANEKPLAHALLVGAGCIAALMLISFACNGRIAVGLHTLFVVCGGMAAAALGGVMGK